MRLVHFSELMLLIAGVSGLFAWRFASRTCRLICVQLLVSIFFEIVAVYLARKYNANNWWYNFYFIVEFSLLIAAGYYLRPASKNRILAVTFLVVYLLVWTANLFYVGIRVLFNWCYIIGGILIASYYFTQLIGLLKKGTRDYVTLLVCLGVLIYFSCSIPFYCFYTYLIQRNLIAAGKTIYQVNHALNIIMYGCMTWGYLMLVKQSKKMMHAGEQ